MAITSVKTLTDTRDGEWSLTRDGFDRSYRYAFLVETDTILDGPATIIQELPFALGDFYDATAYNITEGDPGAQLNQIKLRHVNGNPRLWRVEVGFGSLQSDSPEEKQQLDPTDREAKVRIGFTRVQLPVMGDVTGASPLSLSTTNIAVNTAGQRFNPPPTYERTVPVIRLFKDFPNLTINEVCATQDLINSTDFIGCPSRTLLLNTIDIEERYENAQRVWRKHYEIRHNPLTWDSIVPNFGVAENQQGQLVPGLLSSDSTLLSATQTSNTVYLTHRPYRAVNFATSTDVPAVVQQLPSLNLT